MGTVKLVLNKKAFQQEVLLNPKLGEACAKVLGPDAVVEESDNSRAGGRVRARLYGKLSEEAATGYLSKKIGGG